jgi:hypothetical protein
MEGKWRCQMPGMSGIGKKYYWVTKMKIREKQWGDLPSRKCQSHGVSVRNTVIRRGGAPSENDFTEVLRRTWSYRSPGTKRKWAFPQNERRAVTVRRGNLNDGLDVSPDCPPTNPHATVNIDNLLPSPQWDDYRALRRYRSSVVDTTCDLMPIIFTQ